MKTLRLAEVLLPVLAARGWAPWAVEPQHSVDVHTQEPPLVATSLRESWRDRDYRRRPYDDVQ